MDNVIRCSACGATVSSNSKFCIYCGSKLVIDKNVIDNKNGEVETDTEVDAFVVNDIFAIPGRGVVLAGKSLSRLARGMNLTNIRTSKKYTVQGIEQFRKTVDSVEKETICGILLSGAVKSDFKRNDILKS